MPILGPNVLCYAIIDGQKARLVRIEHQLASTSAYECRDETTGAVFTYFPQNLKPVNSIPSRYSRHMFNGVAHIIGAALDAYPNCIEATPGNLSIETFARRVREARDAKLRYPSYRHPSVDETNFEKFGSLLRTKMIETTTGYKLRVGPKESLSAEAVGKPIEIIQPSENEVLITGDNPDNLERLVRLMHDRVFSPAPNFVVTQITPQQIEDLEARYDVAFVPFEGQPDKYQIL